MSAKVLVANISLPPILACPGSLVNMMRPQGVESEWIRLKLGTGIFDIPALVWGVVADETFIHNLPFSFKIEFEIPQVAAAPLDGDLWDSEQRGCAIRLSSGNAVQGKDGRRVLLAGRKVRCEDAGRDGARR